MSSTCHYENATVERQHLHVIHSLAQQLNQDEDLVRSMYEENLNQLQERATIKDYLSILVSRQVVDSLRGHGVKASR